MRIYLAGASAELETCEYWMAKLRFQGHTITHDWTRSVRASRYMKISDAALRREVKADRAVDDLAGVRDADVFWLLAPSGPSTGAWVELGNALAARDRAPLRVVVSGPHERCIFAALANHHFASHEEAFAWTGTFGGRS